MRVAGLLGANLLMLVVGLGLLPLLGAARSWRQLVSRCGLAYLCGVVLVGIMSAHLALVHVAVGWVGLAVGKSVELVEPPMKMLPIGSVVTPRPLSAPQPYVGVTPPQKPPTSYPVAPPKYVE